MCSPDSLQRTSAGNRRSDKTMEQPCDSMDESTASSSSSASETTTTPLLSSSSKAKNPDDILRNATRLGAASMGCFLMATTLTLPHAQSKRDELGCDSACQGSMTSARSTLTLLGATLVGRLSDWGSNGKDGRGGGGGRQRRWFLLVGVVAAAAGLVAANRATTLTELWISLLPGLFQQNLSIMKALLSDYHSAHEEGSKVSSSSSDRASTAGTLGMAGGLAFMIGPFLGSSLLSSYDQATACSLVFLIVSAILVGLLPSTDNQRTTKPKDVATTKTSETSPKKASIFSMLDVPSARSPAALYVLGDRLLSSLSFHMYSAIWPASLRARFQFGPKDYGLFFSTVGLFLALSQGVASKLVLQRFAGHTSRGRSRLLVICTLTVAVGRYLAFHTSSLTVVYLLYAVLVTAVGISSTILGGDTSQIPAAREVGAFFGVLASVESGAGMIGPLVAGLLASTIHPTAAPLYAVLLLNLVSVVLTVVGYDRCVFQHIQRQKQQTQQEATSKHEKEE